HGTDKVLSGDVHRVVCTTRTPTCPTITYCVDDCETPTPTPFADDGVGGCTIGELACKANGACGFTGRLCSIFGNGVHQSGRCCENSLAGACACFPQDGDCPCPAPPTFTPNP